MTINYTYDGAWNRLKVVQGTTTTTYCYGKYNRLSNYITSACSTPAMSCTYDPNGNMVTRNGTSWKYSYDFENRLTKVVHGRREGHRLRVLQPI